MVLVTAIMLQKYISSSLFIITTSVKQYRTHIDFCLNMDEIVSYTRISLMKNSNIYLWAGGRAEYLCHYVHNAI